MPSVVATDQPPYFCLGEKPTQQDCDRSGSVKKGCKLTLIDQLRIMKPFFDLYDHQEGKLRVVLEDFYERHNDQRLKDFISEVQNVCPYLQGSIKHQNKYLKVLAHFVKDRVYDAYVQSRSKRVYPEISLTYTGDLKPIFLRLGLGTPGSQQDVLYTFTSERSLSWIPSLTHLGFLSAYMSGEGTCTLLTCERLLNVSAPEKTLDELKGAIAADFFINLELIQNTRPTLIQILEHLEADARKKWNEDEIQ